MTTHTVKSLRTAWRQAQLDSGLSESAFSAEVESLAALVRESGLEVTPLRYVYIACEVCDAQRAKQGSQTVEAWARMVAGVSK